MLNLSLWLKNHNFKPDQVQTFYPSPMALATAMYYSERNPLQKLRYKGDKLSVSKDMEQRRLQKPTCVIMMRKTGRCCGNRLNGSEEKN